MGFCEQRSKEEIKSLILELNKFTFDLVVKMQYLEEHLQTAIYCKLILDAFSKTKVLSRDEFINAKLKSEELYQDLSNKTLGSVVATVKTCDLLDGDENAYEDLFYILEKRNHLVHKFFVESNYLSKTSDILYLKSRLTILSDLMIIVDGFLQKLSSKANYLVKELQKIKGKKEQNE